MFGTIPEPGYLGLVIGPNPTCLRGEEGVDVQENHPFLFSKFLLLRFPCNPFPTARRRDKHAGTPRPHWKMGPLGVIRFLSGFFAECLANLPGLLGLARPLCLREGGARPGTGGGVGGRQPGRGERHRAVLAHHAARVAGPGQARLPLRRGLPHQAARATRGPRTAPSSRPDAFPSTRPATPEARSPCRGSPASWPSCASGTWT